MAFLGIVNHCLPLRHNSPPCLCLEVVVRIVVEQTVRGDGESKFKCLAQWEHVHYPFI